LIHDARRTAWLEAQGYRVIRFRNEELMGDLDAVLERIQISL
jgi:very-short-patch-repair endonuclease